MRKKTYLCILLFVSLLCACGQASVGQSSSSTTTTWQEQYDLGLHYLSEGRYEEAIIAFTAAIEIDPKQAPAYVGRGDARFNIVQLSASNVGEEVELSSDAINSYKDAISDYLIAIELDASVAEVYEKAANLYIKLGNIEAAIELLEKGISMTGNEQLQAYLNELIDEKTEGHSNTISAVGQIIYNLDVYKDKWEAYQSEFQNVNISTYGIRFEEPVSFLMGSDMITIQEAGLVFDDYIDPDYESFDSEELLSMLYNFETHEKGPLLNKKIEMTGYFIQGEYKEELRLIERELEDGSIYTYWEYEPNGDFGLVLKAYAQLE